MDETRQVTTAIIEPTQVSLVASDAKAEPVMIVFPNHPFVDLLVNGTKIIGRTRVELLSVLDLRIRDKMALRSAKIHIHEDKMTARLNIEYEDGAEFQLLPGAGSGTVEVTIVERQISSEHFTKEDIENLLVTERVTTNIIWDEIESLINRGESGECLCALGTPPIQGVKEHYQLLLEVPEDIVLVGIYRVKPILSIFRGDVIAQHIDREEGVSGVDVSGKEVIPDSLNSKLPNLGKGIVKDENGVVRSTRSGRLIDTKRLLDVAESFVIEGNHGALDGHIIFDGDVVVNGDVEEGVEIVAGGCVQINGNVSGALIVADEGIVVNGGAFQSKLRAGTRVPAIVEMRDLLKRLTAELNEFIGAVQQLERALRIQGTTLPLAAVAAKLLEDKFKNLTRWSQTLGLWADNAGQSTGTIWVQLVSYIAKEVTLNRLTSVRDIAYWEQLVRMIEKRVSQIRLNHEDVASIQIKTAQNSTLEATGNMSCSGQGYYLCELIAADCVQTSGFMMGCRVQARQVVAKEIGSEAESPARIELSDKDGAVRANIIHPGTHLFMGQWKHRVMKPMQHAVWP